MAVSLGAAAAWPALPCDAAWAKKPDVSLHDSRPGLLSNIIIVGSWFVLYINHSHNSIIQSFIQFIGLHHRRCPGRSRAQRPS